MRLRPGIVEVLLRAAAASWAEEIIVANPHHERGWAIDQAPPRCAAVVADLWAVGQRRQLQLMWTELVDRCAHAAAARGQVAPDGWDLAAGLRDVLPASCDDYGLTRFLGSLTAELGEGERSLSVLGGSNDEPSAPSGRRRTAAAISSAATYHRPQQPIGGGRR